MQSLAIAEAWIAARSGTGGASGNPAHRFLNRTSIPAAFRAALSALLGDLWAKAWALGWQSALTLLAGLLGRWPAAVPGEYGGAPSQLARAGLGRVGAMARTRLGRLEQILETAPEDITASELAELIDDELGDMNAATLVTQTEVTWALSQAMLTAYLHADVARAAWETAGDGEVCVLCLDNQAQGFIPVGDQFASGDTQPPAHPRCRCALLPGPLSPYDT